MIHVNHWNITSGTGSYTWPVYSDVPVHPITLQCFKRYERSNDKELKFWIHVRKNIFDKNDALNLIFQNVIKTNLRVHGHPNPDAVRTPATFIISFIHYPLFIHQGRHWTRQRSQKKEYIPKIFNVVSFIIFVSRK